MAKILLVEDDRRLAPWVIQCLEDHHHEVRWCRDGSQAIAQFKSMSPDLVLLDIMLPGKDGLTLCQEMRSLGKTAILMLTARGDETDRVLGLELGADDYLTKPFGLKELLARIKAILRRCEWRDTTLTTPARSFGEFTLELESRRLLRCDQQVLLTRSEFDILELLTRSPGTVLSRDQLLDQVKGGRTEAFDRAVDTHVSNLRKKIERDPKKPTLIQTVWGIGYRFQQP